MSTINRDSLYPLRLSEAPDSRFAPELATADDVDELLALRDAAARWLMSQGITQWQPGEVSASLLRERIHAGATWIARMGGNDEASDPRRIVGSVSVLFDDVFVWGDVDGLDRRSGYIHGLFTARSGGRPGLGRELGRWAETLIAEAGLDLVRLDCVASNRRLRGIYESWGYRFQRLRQFPEHPIGGRVWHPAALYEKCLA